MILAGLLAGYIVKKIGLPALLGMLLAGIAMGPAAFNLVDERIMPLAADLRLAALTVILCRAGLALDLRQLKKVGRPALLMCAVPALMELTAVTVIAPHLLNISYLEAGILGTVLAAVSPAVVVPRMLKLMQENLGTGKSIPQMIMAAASVDDVLVIVIFSSLVSAAQSGGGVELKSVLLVPLAVMTGVAVGLAGGWILAYYFKKFHMRDSVKVLILLSAAFLFMAVEKRSFIPFSGLLAIMFTGIGILKFHADLAGRLSRKFEKIWVLAEVLLFVLVGMAVDVRYAVAAGLIMLLVIFLALIFRMLGVGLCLIKTPLNGKERLFCMFAYLPKATVQAAIGAIPLALNLPCGKLVLTAAVLSILFTAPLGAWLIDVSCRKLLDH